MRKPLTKSTTIKRLYDGSKELEYNQMIEHIYNSLKGTKFETSNEYVKKEVEKLKNN